MIEGEPIRGRFGAVQDVGAGWGHGCAMCGYRSQARAICLCVACGSSHSLCFDCLTAMADLGMVKERIEERVEETWNNCISRRVTTFNVHDILWCPSRAEVRTAAFLGKR